MTAADEHPITDDLTTATDHATRAHREAIIAQALSLISLTIAAGAIFITTINHLNG